MPRKRKGVERGSSPEKLTQTGLSRVGQQYGGGTGSAVWSEVAKGGMQVGQTPSQDQEKTFYELQDMFKGVDADVIYMVLADSDWKVDEAVEKLLVLGQDHTTSPQEVNNTLQNVAQSIRNSVHQQQNTTDDSNVNMRSRLPAGRTSESEQQIPTLSPKTPLTANPNQHPFAGHNAGIGDSSNLQSAMDAIGSYANNPQSMLNYLHGYHEPTSFDANVFNVTGGNLSAGFDTSAQSGFGLESLSQNFPRGDNTVTNLDSQTAGMKLGFPNVNDTSLGILNNPLTDKGGMFPVIPMNDQNDGTTIGRGLASGIQGKNDHTVKPGRLGSTHKPPDAYKRKGHRKKTLSLNPEEREDLENLIEDVILSGVGDGVIDSEDSTSTDSDEDGHPSQLTDSDKPDDANDKQQDSSSGSDKEKPQRGKKGKQGKDGKVYPAQLKVAVKHMKNLPPRFLRRLQTAEEKKKEANAKNEPAPDFSDLTTSEVAHQIEILTIKEQPEKEAKEKEAAAIKEKEKQRSKQEKKQKIRNMLDDLDQYEDEENKPDEKDASDKDNQGDTLQTTSPHNSLHATSPGPQAPTSPNNRLGGIIQPGHQQGMYIQGTSDIGSQGPTSPPGQGGHMFSNMQTTGMTTAHHPMYASATNCEELERELMKTYDGSGLTRSDQSAFATPPSVRRNRNQAKMSHSGKINQLPNPSQFGAPGSQFSVNAPEFVPRSFTPTSLSQSQVPGQLDQIQTMPQGVIQLPNLSQPPPVFPMAVSSGGSFQTPLGRLSPQMSNVNLSSPSSQPPMSTPSSAAGYSAVENASTLGSGGNQVQGNPSFMIPKIQQNVGSNPVVPSQPGTGVGLIPFQTSYPPPNMAPFGAYPAQGPVYPQQYQFRAPFLPHLGFGWAKDSKSPNKQFGHPPNPRMNTQGKHPGQKDKKGQLTQTSSRPGSGNNNNKPIKGIGTSAQDDVKKINQNIVIVDKAKQKVQNLMNEGKKVLILVRGCPGSGKSTLAKEITFNGVCLSTDDFFMRNGHYEFDYGKLGEAHEWNQKRAKDALASGINPVIIDNTNSQSWEMKPYVYFALKEDYHIEIFEPDTPWRMNPKELAKRNTHGVSLEAIQNMVDRFELNVTLESILGIHIKIPKGPENTMHEPPAEQSTTKKSRKKKKKKRKKDKKKRAEKSGDAADDESSDEDILTDREASQEKDTSLDNQQAATTSNVTDGANSRQSTVTESKESVDRASKSTDKSDSNDQTEKRLSGIDILPTITEGVVFEAPGEDPESSSLVQEQTVQKSVGLDPDRGRPKDNSAPSVARTSLVDCSNAMTMICDYNSSGSSEGQSPSATYSTGLEAIVDAYGNNHVRLSDVKIKNSLMEIDKSFKLVQNSLSSLRDIARATNDSNESYNAAIQDALSAVSGIKHGCDDRTFEESYWKDAKACDVYNSTESAGKTEDKSTDEVDKQNQICENVAALTSQALPQRQKRPDRKQVAKGPILDENITWDTANHPNGEPRTETKDVSMKNASDVSSESGYLEEAIRQMINKGLQNNNGQSCSVPVNPFSPLDNLQERAEESANYFHNCTSTEAKDFVIVHKIVTGQGISTEERGHIQNVLNCSPRIISPDSDLSSSGCGLNSPSRPFHIKIDKGCSTADLADYLPDNGVDFLSSCFPTVSPTDLNDIIQQCGGDTEWAVNLLLDSGFEYNDPNHNSISDSVGDSIEEPQIAADSPILCEDTAAASSPKTVRKTPLSLMTICHDSLKSKGAVTEKQYREFADQTLNRLRKSDKSKQDFLSGSETTTTSIENCHLPILADSIQVNLDVPSPNNPFLPEGLLSSEASQTVRRQQRLSESEMAVENEPSPTENEKDDLVLTLNPQIATQLIQMFGPVGFHITPDSLAPDDFAVRLNRKTARNIHRRWALTMQEKFTLEEAAIQKMMIEDEEMARRLQAEENSLQSTKSPTHTNLSAENLRDIMNEEMAIEVSRKEYLKSNPELLAAERSMSSKLKRQKFGEMYPQIDAALLDEVFQATECSLEASVRTVQASTGDKPKVAQTVFKVDTVSEADYEDTLLKQILKESMDDQWLGVNGGASNEFQAVEDPDYHDFRAEASMHYRLRQELFQKAQEAYKRGMRNVASFYSQQGHLHTERLRDANKRAAEHIMASRNRLLRETNSIDLHGLHVDEAIDALQNVLLSRESELRLKPNKKKQHLSVITGRGLHSRGGVARIKPAVTDFLNRNGYSFSESSTGLLKVLVKHNG